MYRLKYLFFVVIFVTLFSVINSITFEEYPMGCYSLMKCGAYNNPFFADRDSILSIISKMGYNLVQIDNVDGDHTLSGMLSKLSSNQLLAIINDKHYPWPDISVPNEHYNPYSTSPLTTSSYLKFEAEYAAGNDIDDGSIDANWYCSHAEHGGNMPRVGASTNDDILRDQIWKCTRGTTNPGFAYTDVRWRWQNNYYPSAGYEPYKRLGDEFWVYNEHDSANDNNRFIYIRYRLKLENFIENIDATTPLLSFTTVGCLVADPVEPSDSTLVNHQFIDYNSNLLDSHTTDYCYGDFMQAGSQSTYYYIEIKISYADMIESGLMNAADWWKYSLVNLNPRVFWHGNCDLNLDYIEIEDQMHYNLTHDSETYANNINNRIDYLQNQHSSDIIKYLYSLDEPKLGQFDSYGKVQQHISETNPNIITAAYDTHYQRIEKAGNNDENYLYYDHVKCFRDSAQPNTILPDMYPIQPGISFNSDNPSDHYALQTRIDEKVLRQYKYAKKYSIESIPHKTFIPIVQTFGEWTGSDWKTWLLPPFETQKCLKYIPLCYGADGIIDYRVVANFTGPLSSNPYGQYCSIMIDSSGLMLSSNFTRDAVMATNRKIAIYGPFIKHELKWIGADCLKVDSEPADMLSTIVLSNAGLSSAKVEHSGDGFYQGYIQCGIYEANLDQSDNYFMLVNRRTNYSANDTLNDVTPPSAYGTHYLSAEEQNALLVVNNIAHQRYGSYVSLFDMADSSLTIADNDTLTVSLAPGDGKLLQMCSSLPTLVTNNADLKSIAYLSGDISIDQGAVVTIDSLTTTNIFANSTIRVKGGSTLNISGTVEIADSVSIIVEDGSEIIFNNAICNWGLNSILQVDDSGITATDTILQSKNIGETWQGLRISNANTIDMEGTTITGANSNEVTDSPVLLADCRFNIPTNGTGLSIINHFPDQTASITSKTDNKGFYSIGTNAFGLYHDNPNAHLFLNNIVFDGLFVGFGNGLSTVVGDTIQYCYFSNNRTGMHLIGLQYSPLIHNCTFSENSLGAYFEAASPKVTECSFISCDEGIRTELSTATTGGIYDSEFSWGDIGIVSRSSNQRVADNKFYTNTGILNHAGSILNMGNSAKNVFKAEHDNLKFKDTVSYTARVQLYEGHNDFYHKNPGPFNPSIDFQFDSNWNVGGVSLGPINANYNWFEDYIAKIDSPGTPSHYAYCNYYDPSPNVFLENNDRMAQAMNEESAENYYSANNMYKTILDENEISEAELLFDALDAYYRTADLAGVSHTGTEAYLLAKIDQYETENSILIKYLEDYLVKNYLQAESFQAAIDLLELRILNAESPVDSLHAVMNLEIVLQLAAMSASKKPISTKFTQYKYPDRLTFKLKHEEHWELLDELLNHEDINLIPIPAKALISSNYPNPFNPSTTIAYSIPKDGMVRIGIYNIKGQKVKELCNSEMPRGHHKVLWDGKDAKRRNVSSGIYFVKLQASGAVSTRKIMLMK